MRQFTNILVAIDFSTYSKAAAKHAMDLARELDAMVIFLHVMNQRDTNLIRQAFRKIMDGKDTEPLVTEYLENVHKERIDKLEDLVQSLNSEELPYQVVIRSGVPYLELLKAITKFKADLLVIGAKGKSDTQDSHIGSTSWKMFRRCPIPLITVRDYRP